MSGIIRFSSDRRRRVVPAAIPRTQVKKAKLVVEIIEDRRTPQIFLSVVQKQDSSEILFLGQARSRSEAEAATDEFTSEYLGRRKALRKPA